MPPKFKITKEQIIESALDIVRREGSGAINARNVAKALGCSTQPVFSNFETMDKLRFAVAERANELCEQYLKREVESGKYPPYKANGMAYTRFAKEERELFKLLYMFDRSKEAIPENEGLLIRMENTVQGNTGLDAQQAKLFHFEMWAFVHGIATMLATGYLDIPDELISKMLSDAYLGLRKQYGME